MEAKATDRQIRLIENLYAQLRIRNTSLYGGAQPAQLTKQRASEVIDVLTLRKLSGQAGRPVTADVTNPVQVQRELSRVQQLTDTHHTAHAAATAKRAAHVRDASRVADTAQAKENNHASEVRRLPHVLRRQTPRSPAVLSAQQLAARATALDARKEPRLDAASRYTDVTGYGSSASYRRDNRSACDAPELTDEQERKIIELQNRDDDNTVISTVAEASDYLDQKLSPSEPPAPTERQLAYLHKLERQAGKTDEQLSHPGTRQGASRRIQRYLDAAAASADGSSMDELAVAVALTDAASQGSSAALTPSGTTNYNGKARGLSAYISGEATGLGR